MQPPPVRALFLREEDGALVLGSGLRTAWLESSRRLAYGPTATRWGLVSVTFMQRDGRWHVHVDARWHAAAPRLRVALPGFNAGWIEAGPDPVPLVAVEAPA